MNTALFRTSTLNDARIKNRKTDFILVRDADQTYWVYPKAINTKHLISAFGKKSTIISWSNNLNKWVSIPGALERD